MTDPRNRVETTGILLHLAVLGIVAAAIITLFGGAASSLLAGNKALEEARLAKSVIAAKTPEMAAAVGSEAPLTPAETEPRASVSVEIPPPSEAEIPSPSDPIENAEAKADLAPAPREATDAIPESTSVVETKDQPVVETTAEQEQTISPRPPAAGGIDAAPPRSKTTTDAVASGDEERDRLFRSLQSEDDPQSLRQHQGKTDTNQTSAEELYSGHLVGGSAHPNPRFWNRVRRECGPINDPALHRHCIATFSTYYR